VSALGAWAEGGGMQVVGVTAVPHSSGSCQEECLKLCSFPECAAWLVKCGEPPHSGSWKKGPAIGSLDCSVWTPGWIHDLLQHF
jgi:hypothetical protein